MTALQKLLGVELPIIQAPMAGSQGSALTIAVCQAGGLGSLPCAMLSPEQIRSEITEIRRQTGRPFNLNFFCHQPPTPDPARDAAWRLRLAPYYRELGADESQIPSGPGRLPFDTGAAEIVEEFRPAVVSFHFGLPTVELLARVKATGAKVLSSATTVDEALWLQQQGADCIVAQGLEAGGHRGHFLSSDLTRQMGTFALLPQIVRAVSCPVIAAGGIASEESVAAALALGAAGVQIGTAYLLCPESKTSPIHRAALRSPDARHTALTNLFSGRPARGIVNRVMREIGPLNEDAPHFPLATSAMLPLRTAAEKMGSGDFSPLWSGQNAAGCREVSAGQLTREFAARLTQAGLPGPT